MYLLSSVELLFALALNYALWFAYLALKSVAVSPTYFSSFSLVFTVAWYTMSLERHFPCNGHVVFLGQLHSFWTLSLLPFASFLLLFPSMIVLTFGIQL